MSNEDNKNEININTILLPKFSNIIFKLNNQISSGNIQNIVSMSKEHSKEIRETLIVLTEQNRNTTLFPTMINLLMIFSYFDFFVVHSDDFRYMFKIKNELIAKYGIELALSQSMINSATNLKDSIINLLEKIKQDLSLCDIKSALNKIKDMLCIFEQKHNELISFEPLLDYYKDIYIQLGYVLDNLSRITEEDTKIDSVILLSYMNEDFSNKIKECRTTFNFIENELKQCNPALNINNNMLILTSQIIGIIGGDEKLLLNNYNKKNFHSIVCAHVFYRFYYHNFNAHLIKDLKDNCKIDSLNSILLEILSPSDNKGDKLFEFIQKLKGSFPFLLRFHILLRIVIRNVNSIGIEKEHFLINISVQKQMNVLRTIHISMRRQENAQYHVIIVMDAKTFLYLILITNVLRNVQRTQLRIKDILSVILLMILIHLSTMEYIIISQKVWISLINIS